MFNDANRTLGPEVCAGVSFNGGVTPSVCTTCTKAQLAAHNPRRANAGQNIYRRESSCEE